MDSTISLRKESLMKGKPKTWIGLITGWAIIFGSSPLQAQTLPSMDIGTMDLLE
jgi:hypothetical protein